jgi:hypothetical protein
MLATGTARASGRTGVGTWVALKYRVPAAATSMSRNGIALGYCTTRSPSVTRTIEAPRSRTSKKTRAMSTPMGNSQAWPWPQARAGSAAASRRAKNDKVKAATATPRPRSRAVGGGGGAWAAIASPLVSGRGARSRWVRAHSRHSSSQSPKRSMVLTRAGRWSPTVLALVVGVAGWSRGTPVVATSTASANTIAYSARARPRGRGP